MIFIVEAWHEHCGNAWTENSRNPDHGWFYCGWSSGWTHDPGSARMVMAFIGRYSGTACPLRNHRRRPRSPLAWNWWGYQCPRHANRRTCSTAPTTCMSSIYWIWF